MFAVNENHILTLIDSNNKITDIELKDYINPKIQIYTMDLD